MEREVKKRRRRWMMKMEHASCCLKDGAVKKENKKQERRKLSLKKLLSGMSGPGSAGLILCPQSLESRPGAGQKNKIKMKLENWKICVRKK